MEDQVSDPDEPRPDHPVASSICSIDKKSVHRICSGQVVLTLGTAVKELLENSIDAGATIVEIKLKEYGCELVEVSDNGIGVHPANFEGLTLKHHTSKLRDFGDLINVETFGFRGEALSSLCALCDMGVTTRHKDESVGTKLEFDHNGKITKQDAQARQVGTKVMLQNLFYTLPVRHKEFQRNIKKEFAKMVQVLNSYCIISTGVRITCTNVTAKGSRSTVVSSQGNNLLQENISNVFGPKQVQSLLEFKQKIPNEDVCTEYGLKVDSPSLFKIEGFVSKCEHGQGRSSTDRQFFFINGRPFDSTKLSKVINEVYHQYNRHQYPFVVLKIGVNKDGVDVNVTPDKRQVFVEGEKILLATVKCSLNAMFESTTSFIQLRQPDIVSKLAKCHSEPNTPRLSSESNIPKQNSVVSSLSKLKRSFSSAFAREGSPFMKQRSPSKSSPLPKQRRMDCFMKTDYSPVKDNNTPVVTGHSIKLENDTVTNRTLFSETQTTINGDSRNTETLSESSTTINCGSSNKEALSEIPITTNGDSVSAVSKDKQSAADHDVIVVDETGDHVTHSIDRLESNSNSAISNTENYNSRDLVSESMYSVSQHSINEDTYTENACSESDSKIIPEFSVKVHVSENGYKLTDSLQENDKDIPVINIAGKEKELLCESQHKDNGSEHRTDGLLISFHGNSTTNSEIGQHDDNIDCKDEANDVHKSVKMLNFSLQQFKEKWKLKATKTESTESFCRSFRAKINPTDNVAAEQELQREIKKESFSQMEILGQFNMGFIITKLGEDLFIVDQHATDEKFNFETLQRDYVIQSQKLICPMNLELTASNETILMDNLDIFRKNGFEFLVDEMGPPTQRVKLTSTPVSKNWNFGKEDIEEMIFMLTDSPGVMCRPSRVRAMFASRACRKSIMIGTVLNKGEMRKLVNHMGEIEQPWNCPHGRPTMRHLINLDMIPK